MPFNKLGLMAELQRAVSAQGYERPTPIQEQGIPLILKGRDVLAGAQTGTGKTAAFTLPMLQLLTRRGHPKTCADNAPRALVLAPTRELAAQVGESVATYGAHLPLKSTVVFGGVNINPQKDALRRGVDETALLRGIGEKQIVGHRHVRQDVQLFGGAFGKALGAAFDLAGKCFFSSRLQRLRLVGIRRRVGCEAEAVNAAQVLSFNAYAALGVDHGIRQGLLPQSAGQDAGPPIHETLREALMQGIGQLVLERARGFLPRKGVF